MLAIGVVQTAIRIATTLPVRQSSIRAQALLQLSKQRSINMTTDDLNWPWEEFPPHEPLIPPFIHYNINRPLRRFDEENLPWELLNMMDLNSTQNYREVCFFLQQKKELFFTDYSSQAILLLNIVEREINQSIVQWQRKMLGIDVRNFFAAYQKDRHALYHGEDIDNIIDFNRYCNDAERRNWQAPTQGQSCAAIRTYCQRHHVTPFPEANALFFSRWAELVSRRNRIIHLQTTRTYTLNEFYELKTLFESFMFSYLAALSKLRAQLLGVSDDDKPFPNTLPNIAD